MVSHRSCEVQRERERGGGGGADRQTWGRGVDADLIEGPEVVVKDDVVVVGVVWVDPQRLAGVVVVAVVLPVLEVVLVATDALTTQQQHRYKSSMSTIATDALTTQQQHSYKSSLFTATDTLTTQILIIPLQVVLVYYSH